MKLKKLREEIKGVFKPPVRKAYFGKIKHGCPYFYPRNFNSSIISVRKLSPRTKEDQEEYFNRYPHMRKSKPYKAFYSNFPMVTRCRYWVKKIFGNSYYIKLGSPICFKKVNLGWKDKFNTPRFEWSPAYHLYFFRWQISLWYVAPGDDQDLYWEMVLWHLHYSEKDINKAEESWGWVTSSTKESTWNKEYLL